MRHATDIFPVLVNVLITVHIRGWFKVTLNHLAIHIHHNYVEGSQLFVADTGGFEHDQPGLKVAGADIATRPHNEVVFSSSRCC